MTYTLHLAHLIYTGDVFGSIEAIQETIDKLENSVARIKVVRAEVGDITESDIELGDKGILIGFNVRLASKSMQSLIKQHQVHFLKERVIYHLIENVNEFLDQLQKQDEEEKLQQSIIGKAHILRVIQVDSTKIAGCKVVSGRIAVRDCFVRVHRGKDIIFKGLAWCLSVVYFLAQFAYYRTSSIYQTLQG
jgi:translation initiation factor IF-2